MNILDTLLAELEAIVNQQQLPWTVAASPPAGHEGPCVAIQSLSESYGSHTSLAEYPVWGVEVSISGIEQGQLMQARQVVHTLARREWASDDFVALSGKVKEITYARDEGARQEWWVVTGQIEFETQTLED